LPARAARQSLSRQLHDAMGFLVSHLPPGLRLVLASRSEPPLPLARLQARGQVAEVGAADLRFTTPEAAELTNLYWKQQTAPGRRAGDVDTAEVSFAAGEAG